MFSNTAYEALYEIIGLELHAKFIEVITGEAFFKGLILLIFGAIFFFSVIRFASRYIPGSLVEKRHVPLSKFIKIIACLFLGLAILRVGTETKVVDYQGKNWAQNPYVVGHFAKATETYRVSFVFQIMSKTAEELAALLARIIDDVFAKGNPQLTAPNMFYKAIMYAGISTIDDEALRDKLQFYSEECFTKVIPAVDRYKERAAIDGFFAASREVDKQLGDVTVELGRGVKTTCLDLKGVVGDALKGYASEKTNRLSDVVPAEYYTYGAAQPEYIKNYTSSMALVDYYMNQREGRLGIQKGAEIPGDTGGFFMTFNRIFHWDGLLGGVGARDLQGASEAASRAQEFSEHLARAPHVAGFAKAALVMIFPWLMFFVVAGYWRLLIAWFWIYLSILMWTPLWALLYHVMLGIAMSGEMMEAFGRLTDGVSVYAAGLINSRLYYMFSIYSWVQLLVATLTTGVAAYALKPLLGQSSSESAPEFLGNAQNVGGTGVDLMQAKSLTGVAEALL